MSEEEGKYIGVREDFFNTPMYPLKKVHLMGSRCHDCEEVFLGKVVACQCCQSENLESITLGRTGKLYSYTVVRHRPPGNYKGPEPFEPYAVGLVELPEGVRILSPLIDCHFDELKIGMNLELVIEKLYEDEEGRNVLTYKFRPQERTESR